MFLNLNLLFLLSGCTAEEKYYQVDDYYRVEKIDAHVHINLDNPAFVNEARKAGFKLMAVNVDYSDFPALEVQQQIACDAMHVDPDIVAFAASFYMKGWDDPDWQNTVIAHMDSMILAGASAIKVWKNIGMDFRDAAGELVMVDDAKFDAIFDHLRQKSVTVIGHMGEPKSCWLPVDDIPIKYIREYFIAHPQYHMYLHPEMPSYEQLMHVRNSMLEKHRHIEFVGAHLASLEWSVDELARFLDRFPAADVDMAARIGNLQYQSSQDREKVRQFFLDYQDRILYATDLMYMAEVPVNDFISQAQTIWRADWKYLASDSIMTNAEFEGSFQGLHLPASVIEKIYAGNAKRKFPGAWEIAKL